MKELYTEELATHGGPESCVDIREGVGEALTGARVGEVSSREIIPSGCRRGSGLGRQHGRVRDREHPTGPARSQTLCMHARLHAREPGDPSSRPYEMVVRAASERQSRNR
jgi:hypothetical protein